MEILVLLIPLSIVLVGCAIYGFIWAVNNQQFDHLDQCAYEAISDDHKESNHEPTI